LEPGELRTVAVPTSQCKIRQVVAPTASTRHQVLDLERAVEELLGGEAVLALMMARSATARYCLGGMLAGPSRAGLVDPADNFVALDCRVAETLGQSIHQRALP
jgi:hypothetical protein